MTTNQQHKSTCKICGEWGLFKRSKSKICTNCKKKIKQTEREKRVVQCALEGCTETFIPTNANTRYCIYCKGLNTSEKKLRIKQLQTKK